MLLDFITEHCPVVDPFTWDIALPPLANENRFVHRWVIWLAWQASLSTQISRDIPKDILSWLDTLGCNEPAWQRIAFRADEIGFTYESRVCYAILHPEESTRVVTMLLADIWSEEGLDWVECCDLAADTLRLLYHLLDYLPEPC